MLAQESLALSQLKIQNENLKRQLEMASAIGAYINFTYDFKSDKVSFILKNGKDYVFDITETEFSDGFAAENEFLKSDFCDIFPAITSLKFNKNDYIWDKISTPVCGYYIYHCPQKNIKDEIVGACGYLVSENAQNNAEQLLNFIDQAINIDPLTKLFTLAKFKNLSEKVYNENKNKKYVIIFSDINNFKYINDTFGFLEGDRVLLDFANLLKHFFGQTSIIGRHSADKFLIFREFTGKDELLKQLEALNDSFRKEKLTELPSAAIDIISGACLVSHNTGGINAAIDNANTARKRLKETNTKGFVLYNEHLEKVIYNEMSIITNMQTALNDREFKVYLQPKISFKEEKIIGAEALVRWIRFDGSMVYPNDFIPLFEKNGFIVSLDYYMLDNVCALQRKWIDMGKNVHTISVNVSRIHVSDVLFPKKCKSIADKYNLDTSLIELELTEGIFFSELSDVIRMLEELKSYGFSISIDDFGSGYSSLNILKDLPADILKIDKGFFSNGMLKTKDKIIVEGVVSLAKNLNMTVLCEGVENRVQFDYLKSINCDIAQGYYFSKPIFYKDYENKYL